ncbi:iron ABC transporter permease [Methylomarinovum caldicuralii]|nr:iron ABC transporter permease [Methylomarinovum caldicuralii]
MPRRPVWMLGGLILMVALIVLVSLGVGAVPIAPRQVSAILSKALAGVDNGDFATNVVLLVRLPRVILGLAVGAVLALSGAVMQGLFRNPLADPALIGISAGAALGAVAAIVLDWHRFGPATVSLAAFAGGLGATRLVQFFASITRPGDTAGLLLAGIAVNALGGAVTGLFTYLADDQQLRALTFWSMGSLGGVTWTQLRVGLPLLLAVVILLPCWSKALNALLLGEAEAGHLGFAVQRLRRTLVALVALGVGAAVALTGIIGFIGLVAPHLVRLWLGPDHRSLLPGAALTGAALLLLADLGARTLEAPAELPIGILTGLLGGPFFLWLLYRSGRGRMEC